MRKTHFGWMLSVVPLTRYPFSIDVYGIEWEHVHTILIRCGQHINADSFELQPGDTSDDFMETVISLCLLDLGQSIELVLTVFSFCVPSQWSLSTLNPVLPTLKELWTGLRFSRMTLLGMPSRRLPEHPCQFMSLLSYCQITMAHWYNIWCPYLGSPWGKAMFMSAHQKMTEE